MIPRGGGCGEERTAISSAPDALVSVKNGAAGKPPSGTATAVPALEHPADADATTDATANRSRLTER
jgi:hypothetical protein